MLCIIAVFAVMRWLCVWLDGVPFVYCVETAKDTAVIHCVSEKRAKFGKL